MNILIVYGSQFGNTGHLAKVMGAALEPRHSVRIVPVRAARELSKEGADLLLVGAPTQLFGRRLLVRAFLEGLEAHGFGGMPAAAFDTRMGTPTQKNASEAEIIARILHAAGCRIVAPPESFLVTGFTGPLAPGEEERARAWALDVVDHIAVPAA